MTTDNGTNPPVRLEVDGASGDATLEGALASIMKEYYELFKKKQASYGPGNIARSRTAYE